MSMSKGFALVLVLVFLMASCIIVAKPVSGALVVGNSRVETINLNIPSVNAQLEEFATVTVLASTGGTTDPPTGTNTYYVDTIFCTTVSLTAYPDKGFVFLYWEIYAERSTILYGNPATITVGASGGSSLGFDCSVQAVFQPTPPPKISILSPLNQTYNESSVPLLFTTDKAVNWTGYSLDGKQNVTINCNSTVVNMTNGLHNITVYANDTFGNIGASENITFQVELPEPSKPFPTALVAAVSGASAVVVVVAGLLVYLKKRKR
jgi:hypothetical protein